MAVINQLLAASRRNGIPVNYTTFAWWLDGFDISGWAWMSSQILEGTGTQDCGNEISPEIAPEPTDIALIKKKPSASFGMPPLGYLTDLKVDSVIVTGMTTSGRVGATVIDAFSHDLHCAVVEDGSFDRSEISHAITLLDMNAKAADVLPSGEVLDYIEQLPEGLFDVPKDQALAK